MKTLLCKIAAVVIILVGCHYLWHSFHLRNMRQKFSIPTEITSAGQVVEGDPVTINIKGIVKYTDNHGLMVIEYKDSVGLPQQMVFHTPHTHDKIK